MTDDTEKKSTLSPSDAPDQPSPPKQEQKQDLPEAAKRALAEAEERRQKNAAERDKAGETGGPAGPEPTRYGDWERKGRAVDF